MAGKGTYELFFGHGNSELGLGKYGFAFFVLWVWFLVRILLEWDARVSEELGAVLMDARSWIWNVVWEDFQVG